MGIGLALLALVLWSATNIVTKFAVGAMDLYVGVLVAAAANFVFAALLFGAQILWFRAAHPLDWWAALMFLVSGIFSTYLGRWFFFATIARLGPARASAFQVTNPMFTILIALLFLGESLKPAYLGAAAITLCGLGLVSYVPSAWSSAGEARGTGASGRWALLADLRRSGSFLLQSGALLALGSSVSYAVANVLRGAAVRRWNEPVLGGALAALAGMLAQVALMRDVRTSLGGVFRSDRRGMMLYTLTGALMIGAQISLIAAMAYIPIGVANLIGLSTPLLVTPASIFLLKNQEGVTGKTILGIGLVLAGIVILVLR